MGFVNLNSEGQGRKRPAGDAFSDPSWVPFWCLSGASLTPVCRIRNPGIANPWASEGLLNTQYLAEASQLRSILWLVPCSKQ
jgi:hypothetical protein